MTVCALVLQFFVKLGISMQHVSDQCAQHRTLTRANIAYYADKLPLLYCQTKVLQNKEVIQCLQSVWFDEADLIIRRLSL